ncbi:MAG: hypothetical protein RIK87_26150 [Fuerstiella sp.]
MPDASTASQPDIAWISHGRLFVKRGDAAVEEIESDFARSSLEREMRQTQNNSWKGRSGVWGNMGMEPPGMAPWEDVDPRRNIRFATVAKGENPGEIYYVLDMGAVGGLFRYDLDEGEETRLMHRQGFTAKDISRHPEDGALAVSLVREDGTVGLSVTRHDGLFGRTITVSDSIDEAPSWLRDGSRRLVFQSSAIARNEQGVAVGKSTYRIEQLDLDTEEIQNLHEEDDTDLLQPRLTDDGTTLYIRRPYRSDHRRPPSLLEVTQDVIYFPFRLARTFVYFFNFMSMAFSGKPLINAGGPDQHRQAQSPYLMLYGQAIDTRHAMASGAGSDKSKPLVPKEWQLVSHSADGSQQTLADNVLCFDSNADGDIVFTDGRRIYQVTGPGQKTQIADGDLIEKVVLLS